MRILERSLRLFRVLNTVEQQVEDGSGLVLEGQVKVANVGQDCSQRNRGEWHDVSLFP